MILAFETASAIGGVALLEGERVLAERALGGSSHRHAAQLLATTDALLRELACELDEVDSIALSIGPGSFTGLRIGLATAQGLCFATERRIIPVPTLAALSFRAGQVEPIAPLLDARKGQVYAGLYGPGGKALLEDAVRDPLPWLEELRALGSDVWLLGPGARLYQNEIRTVLAGRARLIAPERGEPSAGAVGKLAAQLAREGAARRPEQVQLRYLRPPEAVQKAAAGHGSAQPIS